MRFRTITALLTTVTIFAACSESATAPAAPDVEAELEAVVAEQSASPNDFARAQDRRDGRPPRDRVTEEQRQCIQDAVEEFRAANAETLDALKAIHLEARAAYAAGASRAEVAAILKKAEPLLERLREAHKALHEKIRACLTS